MDKTVDLKKIALLFIKKIKNIVIFALVGAVLVAVLYNIHKLVTNEGRFYRVSGEYYIEFNLEDYPNGVDHYNAYTWDTILRDDPIVDVVMENLPDTYNKDDVKATISGEMLGDYRILTVHVTSKSPEQAQEIAAAVEKSLITFPQRMDIITSIENWSFEDCHPVIEENRTINAAFVGALLGLVLGLFWFSFELVLDDSIYVEGDYTKYFELPLLGMMTKNQSELCEQELQSNIRKVVKKDKKYYLVHVNEKSMLPGNIYQNLKTIWEDVPECLSMKNQDLELLKAADGIILMMSWGKKNSRMLEKAILFLEKQECQPCATIVYGAEDKFLQKYYGVK